MQTRRQLWLGGGAGLVVLGWALWSAWGAPDASRNSDGSPRVGPPGPPSEPPYTLVLPYDAFGPQVLAISLLGPAWWSWAPGGSWAPDDTLDVRVVVYRDRPLAIVAATYPTHPPDRDHRLVAYADALAFLDDALRDPGVLAIPALHQTLRSTRARILESLGHP